MSYLTSLSVLIRLPWWGRAVLRILSVALVLPGGWRLWPYAIRLVEHILQATRVEYVKDDRPIDRRPWHPCLACGRSCPPDSQICGDCDRKGWP